LLDDEGHSEALYCVDVDLVVHIVVVVVVDVLEAVL